MLSKGRNIDMSVHSSPDVNLDMIFFFFPFQQSKNLTEPLLQTLFRRGPIYLYHYIRY